MPPFPIATFAPIRDLVIVMLEKLVILMCVPPVILEKLVFLTYVPLVILENLVLILILVYAVLLNLVSVLLLLFLILVLSYPMVPRTLLSPLTPPARLFR